jgi:hypothetical protein
MGNQTRSSAKLTIACALVAVAIGLFYILYSAGIVGPAPRHGNDGPGWLGFVFGLIFLFGGMAVIIQTVATGGDPSASDLPASTPRGLRLIHHVMAWAIVGMLGIVFSWVAIGPGQRDFTGSGSIVGETGGRIAFGIGAVLIWIVLLAMVFVGVRRLLARK